VIPTSHKATGNHGECIMVGILFNVYTGGGHVKLVWRYIINIHYKWKHGSLTVSEQYKMMAMI